MLFRSNNVLKRDTTIERDGKAVTDYEITTYDRIDVTVLKISAPYCHARISEIEFGASKTVAPEEMGEEITHIRDVDIFGLTAPLYELNFSLMNIEGLYDIDHPDSLIDTLASGTPVNYSVSVEHDGRQTTVPLGRYYIIEHNSLDDMVEITAMDARIILSDYTMPVTLNTTTPISTSIFNVLSALGIPHIIDAGVDTVYPARDYTPSEPTDVLSQLTYIAQRYDVHVVPSRDRKSTRLNSSH